MTRDEAVKIWQGFGQQQVEALNRRLAPQHIVDRMMEANAEDVIDGLMALGVLKCEPPAVASECPQDTAP